MNSEINSIINEFTCSGLIFKSPRPEHRMRIERNALKKLSVRNDYLSEYNMALRYVFLFFLEHGYDIQDNMVHSVFKTYCIRVLNFRATMITDIIRLRHNLKYTACDVNSFVKKDLKDVLTSLASKNIKK